MHCVLAAARPGNTYKVGYTNVTSAVTLQQIKGKLNSEIISGVRDEMFSTI